mmetsp:Transcript_9579/g.15913  ORF Transcript_9579/g.15913 Transcript_9579/m.15913 type:complete len:507 (+) Transcript_9579:260-1780(+)
MEFEHVGRLCQVDLCNQKDFLPFICDSCGMSLCLAHRSYTMHHCAGAKGKDMTSIDCPVCSKSVKFDKSQDPNVVWDDHYVNHCSQQQPSVQQKHIVRCFRPGCSTILGPSNTFTCTKCHQKVCMSHRMSEAHNCVGPVRKSFLDRVQNNASGDNHRSSTNGAGMFLQPAFKKKTATTKAAGKKKTGQKEGDPANTLKGTADLRRQRWEQQQQQPPPPPPPPPAVAASSNGPPTTEICPFCQQSMEGGDALMAHILATHPEDSGGSSNSSSSSSSSSSGDALRDINLRFLLSVGLRSFGEQVRARARGEDFTETVACAAGAVDFIVPAPRALTAASVHSWASTPAAVSLIGTSTSTGSESHYRQVREGVWEGARITGRLTGKSAGIKRPDLNAQSGSQSGKIDLAGAEAQQSGHSEQEILDNDAGSIGTCIETNDEEKGDITGSSQFDITLQAYGNIRVETMSWIQIIRSKYGFEDNLSGATVVQPGRTASANINAANLLKSRSKR